MGLLLRAVHRRQHRADSDSRGECVVAVAAAYLINCRSLRRSIFTIGWFSNPRLWAGLGFTALLQVAFTYVPFMNRFLHTAPIDALAWLRVLGIAVATLVIVELEKTLRAARPTHLV